MHSKSGLFKLVSKEANFTVVESLINRKLITGQDRDKIIMLREYICL